MKKQSIILFISLLISFSVQAQRKLKQLDEEEAKKKEQYETQDDKGIFNKDKWTFGGNVGGYFFSGGGFFFAQPLAGYRVTEKTIVGTGITYMYQGINLNGKKYSANIYGPVLFVRQQVLNQLFAHIQYQPINYPRGYNSADRIWENVLYIGGGYGGSKGVYIGALYNILWMENKSFYGSPLQINFGFMF
ncbi:MAG: hypothetical protein H7296_15880 [Bacteroidia bacterium]|nr:hypothetical protein [Bacteroidia bacterium]